MKITGSSRSKSITLTVAPPRCAMRRERLRAAGRR
jgi:hypothetical protein